MMTSSRPRDTGESFASRRGHGAQLSISDTSHHITETIGTLYGDSDDDSSLESRRDSRPLSFMPSPYGGEQIQKPQLPRVKAPVQTPTRPHEHEHDQPDERKHLSDSQPGNTSPLAVSMAATNGSSTALNTPSQHSIRTSSRRSSLSHDVPSSPIQPMSPLSPTLSLRDVPADQEFPLTNIDNPDDIAQELSNLQALRRMSIDVGNTADPDLMPFQGMSLMAMPSIAPTGEDDEGDISRLLWVPAKVHPELAPDQFKSFLENRVQSMKRRSGESLLSVDTGLQPGHGGLQRKKSMLSRQVDSNGTRSGLEIGTVLEEEHTGSSNTPELSLNELVKDPTKVVQKLALDTQRQAESTMEQSTMDDDKPILPAPTMGLRRSTRTTYRKGGSLRSGSRQFASKRAAMRHSEREGDESPLTPDTPSPGHMLQRVSSEPVHGNFSRPALGGRIHSPVAEDATEALSFEATSPESPDKPAVDFTAPVEVTSPIVAAEPPLSQSPTAAPLGESSPPDPARQFPQRTSSQNATSPPSARLNTGVQQQQARIDEQQQQQTQAQAQALAQAQQQQQQNPPPRSTKRPSVKQANHPQLGQKAAPGANDSSVSSSARTDNLAIVPTLPTEDRKSDKKSKEKDENDGGKSMSWKWFKSDDKEKKKKEKDKEKEKAKEREKEEQSKRARAKSQTERTSTDKTHDSARLDVLQSSIDNAGQKRESLVLERDDAESRSREEKKKEGGRKNSDAKKEKDGFFGSIFSSSRRREHRDRESLGGKGKQRAPSPEPPVVVLRPDIDYPYTRFPIVEERAIYRMAHIKLANPRRDLRSQVLLSNFMYSYLAKVQAMHPQLNVPISPQQKRQEEERKRREQEQQLQQQQYLEQQYREQQEQQQLLQQQQQQQQQQSQAQSQTSSQDQYSSFEYHRSGTQYGDMGHRQEDDEPVDYVEDSPAFEYAHNSQANHEVSRIAEQQGQDDRGYYDYGPSDDGQHDDMW